MLFERINWHVPIYAFRGRGYIERLYLFLLTVSDDVGGGRKCEVASPI